MVVVEGEKNWWMRGKWMNVWMGGRWVRFGVGGCG